MHPNRKISCIIVGVIIFSSFLSGCSTLSNILGVSVTINNEDVCDNDGFAGLNINFSCTGTIYLKTFGVDDSEMDSEPFFYGDHQVILNIAPYRSSANQGEYKVKAYDGSNNEVFQETISLNGADLTIDSCSQKWWKRDAWKGGYSLIGLIIDVTNNGDAPAYPYTAEIIADSKSDSGDILPCVVLPGESKTIKCYLYLEDEPSDSTFTLNLKDSDDEILSSNTYDVVFTDTVNVEKFKWSYNGRSLSLSVPYPDFLHEYYKNLDQIVLADYSLYVFDKYDDTYLDLISDQLQFTTSTQTDMDKINFAAAFIQNLDYRSDVTEFDDPNYPLETLFNTDGGCDCEDMSILTASILDRMGYEVALLRLTNHMAVGVKLDTISGYSAYDSGYYFLETTSKNHVVGYIPSAYTSKPGLEIYKIDSRALLVHNWYDGNLTIFKNTERGDVVKVSTIVTNLGLATVENVVVEGVFSTENGLEYNEWNTIPLIKSGMKAKTTILIDIPSDMETDFTTRVYLSNKVVDEVESAESFP